MAQIYEINDKKVLFINPPKCGTNSIEEALREFNVVNIHSHKTFKDIKEMLEEKLDVIKISEEIGDVKNMITENAITNNYKSDIPKS